MQPVPPPFTDVMRFNATLWPRVREDFASGYFTEEDLLKFLDNQKKSTTPPVIVYDPNHVIFIQIPKKLEKIITPGHAYHVFEKQHGQSRMTLDNDYAHWIDDKCLQPCPVDEVLERSHYH